MLAFLAAGLPLLLSLPRPVASCGATDVRGGRLPGSSAAEPLGLFGILPNSPLGCGGAALTLLSANSPQLTALSPCGGKRGTEVVVTLTGQRLFDPEGLLLVKPGLEVGAVKGEKPETCRVTLRIPADCPLGAHAFRLRTKYGLSNLLAFQVGVLDEVQAEQKSQAPQKVPLGCTVNGRLGAEDVHRFALDVAQDTRVVCEVLGTRLGLGLLDTSLAVLAPNGAVVASTDDTALGMKDPWLAFTAGESGTYVVSLTPAFFEGNNAGSYRLHVGTFPRPTGALPCGGQPREVLDCALLGDTDGMRAKVELPDDGSEVFRWFPSDARGTAPTPVLLRVGGPPNRSPAPDAQGKLWVELPGAVHGIVGKPGDSVRWAFRAKRGQEIEWRTFARTLRSPLDTVLTIRQADGRFVVASDDGAGLDSVLRFNPPADGEFTIEVKDLLKRGSAEHFFRLEGAMRTAPMSLRMVVNQNQREEAVVPVPRGGRGGCVLQLQNPDYDAGLTLLAENLPPGITASFGPVRRGLNLVPLVLCAAPDAPLQGAWIDFTAHAEKGPASRPAGYAQDVPVVLVRNNQPLVVAPQKQLPIAVTERAPFTLEVESPKVPIVRGAPLGLRVRVVRAPGFADQVRVRALWNPPGMTAGQLVLEGTKDAGALPLDANGNAPLGTFPYAVVAQANQRGGTLDLCSAFVDVTIDKPWVTAELGKARTEQGKDTELVAKLRPAKPLGAAYQASLIGLPRGVTAAAQEVAPGADGVRFALTVAPDAQVGRHGNFLVELRVPAEGEAVVHRFGGGEIRVDKAEKTAEEKR